MKKKEKEQMREKFGLTSVLFSEHFSFLGHRGSGGVNPNPERKVHICSPLQTFKEFGHFFNNNNLYYYIYLNFNFNGTLSGDWILSINTW